MKLPFREMLFFHIFRLFARCYFFQLFFHIIFLLFGITCTLHHRKDYDEQKAVVVAYTSLSGGANYTRNMLVYENISLVYAVLRSESEQSFTLWQQATIEITCHDHSIIACSRRIYMVLFFAHILFVVNHAFSATPAEKLQQHPLLFTTNHINHMIFVWRLHPARPSHPDHSNISMQLESPSGMCAKLHTVAASNNRDHMPWSLYYCLFTPHICCVVLHAHSIHGEQHIQCNACGKVATVAYVHVRLTIKGDLH